MKIDPQTIAFVQSVIGIAIIALMLIAVIDLCGGDNK